MGFIQGTFLKGRIDLDYELKHTIHKSDSFSNTTTNLAVEKVKH